VPLALSPFVLAAARLVMLDAVTSPPKSENELTEIDAREWASPATDVDAVAVSGPVVTMEPSLGYAKPDDDPLAFGGAETDVELPPAWPGTTTRMP
jgi:hypothetical protein